MPGSGLLRKDCTFTAACNCHFQALAAHGAKRAVYRVVRACYAEQDSPLYGSRPVAFIHDELIVETPTDYIHEAGVELSRLMCETMQSVVPDVRITATPAAMMRWYKSAEAVWRDGRLVPWEPK
jgi:DNA polymerase I-like protein with 3'-5' exonuclease and polymerase domains